MSVDGDRFQQYQLAAQEYEREVFRQIGGELAKKMPKFYGSIVFTLQGGTLVLTAMDYEQNGVKVHKTVK